VADRKGNTLPVDVSAVTYDLEGGWPILRFYFACAMPTLGCPTPRGFRRVGTTELYLLFPHLVRYWTMKRGKLNCARRIA